MQHPNSIPNIKETDLHRKHTSFESSEYHTVKKPDNSHRYATEFQFTFIFLGVSSFFPAKKAQYCKNGKKAYKCTNNYPHNQTSPILLSGWKAVTDSRYEICQKGQYLIRWN